MNVSRLKAVLCMLVVAWAACWLARLSPALAQNEDDDVGPASGAYFGSVGSQYPVSIRREDVTSLARWSGMSRDQREAALSLHAAYKERHEAAAQKLWDYQEAVSGGDRQRLYNDPAISAKANDVNQKFLDFQKKLESEFVDDLRALLTPEQEPAAKWFDQVRNVRSNRWILSGPLMGLMDPVRALESVVAPEEAPQGLREALFRVTSELNSLVSEAEEAQQAAQPELERINQDPNLDEEGKMRARQEAGAWRIGVGRKALDVVTSGLERFKKILTPEQAERLELKLVAGSIIGEFDVAGDRVMRRVEKLSTLTPEQRATLNEVRAAHAKALLAELKPLVSRSFDRAEADPGAQPFDQETMTTLFESATRETERAAAKLRDVLTPEQREEVGPPISLTKIVVPDFDSEEDPPARSRTRDEDRLASMVAMSQSPPETGEADIRLLAARAKMTPEQFESAKDLLAGYSARFRLAARKYGDFQLDSARQNMAAMPSKQDLKRAVDVWVRFDRFKDRIHAELVNDLDALLTEEQKPALDALRAAGRRSRGFSGEMMMMAAGAQADLAACARAAVDGADPSEQVGAILQRYERDMSPLAEKVLESSRGSQERMLARLNEAAEFSIMDLMKSMGDSQQAIDPVIREARALNNDYATQIAQALPEGPRERFEESFYRAAGLGRVFDMQSSAAGSGGKSVPGLALEIQRLDTLSDQQRMDIDAAVSQHAKDARDISRPMYEWISERLDAVQDMMGRQAIFGDAKLQAWIRTRADADTKAIQRLMDLLTPEQQAKLPIPYRPAGPVEAPTFDD